jgi:hypothetical protein
MLKLPTELADETALAVPLRELAVDEHEVVGSHERHVVRAGRARLAEFEVARRLRAAPER